MVEKKHVARTCCKHPYRAVDGFQSQDETAMLVNKTIANSQKTFFSIVLCISMAAVTSGAYHLHMVCNQSLEIHITMM